MSTVTIKVTITDELCYYWYALQLLLVNILNMFSLLLLVFQTLKSTS